MGHQISITAIGKPFEHPIKGIHSLMDAELENVLNGLYLAFQNILMYRIGGNDIVGVIVIDKTGEVIACNVPTRALSLMNLAKGDVSQLSAVEVLQLERSIKGDESAGAFKIGQRYEYAKCK
jgi:hypothetical protein